MTGRTHAPTLMYFKMAERIVRYLKGTKSLNLFLKNDNDLSMPPPSPATLMPIFAADNLDRMSVSIVYIYVNDIFGRWSCKKQSSAA